MKGDRNKPPSFSGDSKSGVFISGQSAQQFKIQSYFRIFDTSIGEGK